MTDAGYQTTSPASVVIRQVDAYNGRDLVGFLNTYDDQAVVVGAAADRTLVGRDQLFTYYEERFSALSSTVCTVVSLTQLDDRWVVLKEVLQTGAARTEAIASFEVVNGRIQRASILKRVLASSAGP